MSQIVRSDCTSQFLPEKKRARHRTFAGVWKLKPLSLAVTAALSVMATQPAQADAPITGSISGSYTWSGGDLAINPGVAISGGSTGVIAGGSSLGTLSNSGQLSGSWLGIYVDGNTIEEINNASSASINGSTYGIGIYSSSSLVRTLTNSGTIGTIVNGFNGIYNEGTINTLINNSDGVISGGSVNAAIYNSRTIGTISNSGLINGGTSSLGATSYYSSGIDNRRTINVINNNSSGTIYGQFSGVYNYRGSGTCLLYTSDAADE